MCCNLLPTRALSLVPGSALLAILGCAPQPHTNFNASSSYYNYDFATARETVREDIRGGGDENEILDHLRLGTAALADGAGVEAERSLGRVFELLSTAGLNADRTTAAVLFNEGVRIWKGEPFEQALAYYYVAALYATIGDWENVRAAASNSLFRLTDFGADQTPRTLVKSAVEDDDYLDTGYTAVDTNFALGFLLQAVGSDLSDAAGAEAQFDAAVKIDEGLFEIAEVLRKREYDTLLLVDYGRGPVKVAYGPDDALAKFAPRLRQSQGPLVVATEGVALAEAFPVCDVNRMAIDHRWNNLEDLRRAKSTIGSVLVTGGTIAAVYGASNDSAEAALAGLGALAAGLLVKSGAAADTRYFEYAPQSVYLIPTYLGEPATLQLSMRDDPGATLVLPDVQPGTIDKPRAIYLRLHSGTSRQREWMWAEDLAHGNDHGGIAPGEFPYILGGTDVSSPSRTALERYQMYGYLDGYTVEGLRELYRQEGIALLGESIPADVSDDDLMRHILEGGRGLFTPHADSIGYKRLMYSDHRSYRPRSEAVRAAADRIARSLAAKGKDD